MMSEMTDDSEEPPSTTAHHPDGGNGAASARDKNGDKNGFIARIKSAFRGKSDASLREAIEEYIEEPQDTGSDSITAHERTLISNVLKLRDVTVIDVMVPRADIVAIESGTAAEELLAFLAEKQYSRIPVYKDTLDDILGVIHIKDILACLAQGKKIEIPALIREVPIVSPAMPVPDLLLQIRQTRKHMAMVVDEYGGIDGLVTIGDVIESIVGEIEDEHEQDAAPHMEQEDDGTVLADARVDLDEFEERFGALLTEEEREENDTLGGLIFSIAGRVPGRGEVLTHDTGMVFEVLEADPRRVGRVRIRNIPTVPG